MKTVKLTWVLSMRWQQHLSLPCPEPRHGRNSVPARQKQLKLNTQGGAVIRETISQPEDLVMEAANVVFYVHTACYPPAIEFDQLHWYLCLFYDHLQLPHCSLKIIKLSRGLTVLAGDEVLRAPSAVYHISWYPGANSCLRKDSTNSLRDDLQEDIRRVRRSISWNSNNMVEQWWKIHRVKAAGNRGDRRRQILSSRPQLIKHSQWQRHSTKPDWL